MSLSPQWAFAFITDIHGNHTALQAVLDDVARMRTHSDPENFELVCLGDSFDGGPDPELVFDALEVLQCAHLRGNHEDYLFECQADPENEKFKRPLWKFVPWTVSRLQNSLAQLKKRAIERWSSEQCNLIAVHASASNNNRVPEFFSQQSALRSSFIERHDIVQARSLYFNGHSHYLGLHSNPLKNEKWINCGSVGYPFVDKLPSSPDAPLATWVWLECYGESPIDMCFSVINRRVPYSSDALLRRYHESGALELCAPFSFAIAAQSLFNTDVVYPFFQRIKGQNLTPEETAQLLVRELERQNVFLRINSLLGRAGMREVNPKP